MWMCVWGMHVCYPFWDALLIVVFWLYSDTSANEGNSFRDHIR